MESGDQRLAGEGRWLGGGLGAKHVGQGKVLVQVQMPDCEQTVSRVQRIVSGP